MRPREWPVFVSSFLLYFLLFIGFVIGSFIHQGVESICLIKGICYFVYLFRCQRNVGGRQCNQCLAGHYGFPHCYACVCDKKGTTEKICDPDSSTCICKVLFDFFV